MDLNDAFKIPHVQSNTYSGTILYDPTCVFCSHKHSIPLMNDGGSFRQCYKCRKNFRAKIITAPVASYIDSTQHLKGTN
jgi:hypothetical protein